MNKKHTRRALLTSIMALILCCAMLVGSTFAWFTDSVASSGNIIKSGNLDVEMGWADGTKAVPTAADGWTDASANAIFNYDLWEPGYVDVKHINISNVGTLALKYVLTIEANGEVSKLAEVIDVYYLDPAQQIENRAGLEGLTPIGTLDKVLAGLSTTAYGELDAGVSDTVTIALKMQETADNEYQDLAIGTSFSVKLFATQLEAEADSFGPDYDEDAYLPVVYTAEELKAALENNESVQLGGNIELTGEWKPIGDKDAGIYYTGTLDGNGYTISGLQVTSGDYAALIGAAKDATIRNLTVEGAVTAENPAGIAARVEGSTVIENCVSNVAVTGSSKAGGIVCNVTNTDPSTVKLINCVNNGTVTGTGTNGFGGMIGYVNNNGIVEIINCTNNGDVTGANTAAQYAGAAIGYAAGTSAGKIDGYTNTGVITGKFNTDTRYLKDGDTYLAGYCATPANWSMVKYPSMKVVGSEYRFAENGPNRGASFYYMVPVGDYRDAAFFSQEFGPHNTFDGEGSVFANVQVLANYCKKTEDVFTVKNVKSEGTLIVSASGGTIVVDHCEFKALRVAGAAKIVIKNSTVNGYGENRNGDNGGYGMYIIPAGDYELTITGNTINNCDMHCIAIQAGGAGKVEVKGNNFKAWGSATNKTERAAFKIWGDTVLAPTNMSSYADLGSEAQALVAEILAENTFPTDLAQIGGSGTQVIFDFFDAAFSSAN